MPKPNRSQHIVPNFYLKGFSHDETRLVVVDRSTGRRYTRPPKTAFVEKDFYLPDGSTPDSDEGQRIERVLEKIEAAAAPAIRRIVSSRSLSNPGERSVVAKFCAAQYLRGPDIREQVNTVLRAAARQHAPDVSDQRRAAILSQHRFPVKEDRLEFQKNAILDRFFLGSIEAASAAFMQMRWTLVLFDTLSLLTSDRPIVPWEPGVLAPGEHAAFGLRARFATSVALDPCHALLFTFEEEPVDDVVAGSAALARRLNQRCVDWARLRLFHHPDHDPLDGITLTPVQSFDDILRNASREPST